MNTAHYFPIVVGAPTKLYFIHTELIKPGLKSTMEMSDDTSMSMESLFVDSGETIGVSQLTSSVLIIHGTQSAITSTLGIYVMLCYMLCYIWHRYSGRSVHYVAPTIEILHPCHSYRDHDREELGLKQLAQGCTCAPGNNPSRGPWALLSEFHLINAPHISVPQSHNAVYQAGKQ